MTDTHGVAHEGEEGVSAGGAPVPRDRHRALLLALLAIVIGLTWWRTAFFGQGYLFDDAFITYRYARNLALGHGVTWNTAGPPAEGYTSLLHVLLLAPFIRFGLDPLLVTRVASYGAALAAAALLAVNARRVETCSPTAAALTGAVLLAAPQTRDITLGGLETLLYAAALLGSVHLGTAFLAKNSVAAALRFAGLLFVAVLLRPEALLVLPLALGCRSLAPPGRDGGWRPALAGTALFLGLCGALGVWKSVHFGSLLPNAFYLKASSPSLITRSGAGSVLSFLTTNSPLAAMVVIAAINGRSSARDGAAMGRNAHDQRLALITIAANLLFFLHVDTLMDFNGRFLFPNLPLMVYASTPILVPAFSGAERLLRGSVAKTVGVAAAYLLVFGAGTLHEVDPRQWQPMRSNPVTEREFALARRLAEFPGIAQVRVAFGDAGVLPYVTGATWLDPVGLNDSFIARTRDLRTLKDYFFGWNADLVIHPSRENDWLTFGHGPLGNYALWADDPRWDDYAYVGTCRTAGQYDLQLLVRKAAPRADELAAHLASRVIDGAYKDLPFRLGSHVPSPWSGGTWLPRG